MQSSAPCYCPQGSERTPVRADGGAGRSGEEVHSGRARSTAAVTRCGGYWSLVLGGHTTGVGSQFSCIRNVQESGSSFVGSFGLMRLQWGWWRGRGLI